MTKPNLAVIAGTQYIYPFEEGDGKDKMLLGGKGANLCEMTQIGLNVPPGFTITTDACLAYLDKNQLPAGLMDGIRHHMSVLQKKTGKGFGSADKTLVSSQVTAVEPGPVKAAAPSPPAPRDNPSAAK